MKQPAPEELRERYKALIKKQNKKQFKKYGKVNENIPDEAGK